MIKMMINWYTVKKTQLELKAALYRALSTFVSDRQDYKKLLQDIYTALKDVPVDELQQKLIEEIAVLVHESNNRYEG